MLALDKMKIGFALSVDRSIDFVVAPKGITLVIDDVKSPESAVPKRLGQG